MRSRCGAAGAWWWGIAVAVLLANLVAGPGAADAQVAPPADVHVAPAGDDDADGRLGRPVRSLRRALDLVRDLRKRRTVDAPIRVEVADGRYELVDTIVVTPLDSATEKAPTVIRAASGASPVFSGGRRITGWTVTEVDGRPRWTVVLPDVARGRWRFTQLFVDNQRRFRPALPAEGWYTVRRRLEPTEAVAGRGHDRFAAAADDVDRAWADRDAIEVVSVHGWTMSRLHIAGVEPLGDGLAAVTLAGGTSSAEDQGAFQEGARFRLENVREALGEPGSWYLDTASGTLTYCPLDGESPETTEVIAPRVDTLLAIRGEPVDGSTVDHVRIEGLSFVHGNWPMPPRGQWYAQGDLNVGAAVTLTGARNVSIVRCGVRHVGRYGLALGVGCGRCVVRGCELTDLGAGGIMIGPFTAGGRAIARVTENRIRDCTITHGGRLHPAGIALWIGQADGTVVERCEIADFTYTGVSVGWTWGYEASAAIRNRIAGNHIHDLGRGVLSDMGGIYTLGVSTGTVVEGNHIHDVVSHGYGGWGVYPDEGSSGIVMRSNVVERTSSGGFHQHYGRENLIENNVFAAGRDWQLQRTRVEGHVGFTFQKNIVWWDSDAALMEGDWTKGLVARDNCYWSGGRAIVFSDGSTLEERQARGLDRGSIVADPQFADPRRGDFTIPRDSPAARLGFRPIDLSRVGRETEPTLAPELPPVPSPWPEAVELPAVTVGAGDPGEAKLDPTKAPAEPAG